MNRNTKIALFSIIALLIAGIALYPQFKKLRQKSDAGDLLSGAPAIQSGKRAALNVNAQIIAPVSLEEWVQAPNGRLIPDEEVDLTFETSGKITDIFFREGGAVKKGELLAKINDKPLQAELNKLKAQVPLAEDRVFRQKSLLEKDAVSQEAYEQVNTDLEKLHADIELVEARIAQTELRAPFDGIIGLRNVSEGAYASPTVVISNLTRITPLKVEFTVSETEAHYLHPGTSITFQVRSEQGNTETFRAEIFAIESKLDLNTMTLKARAIYANPGGRLKPGLSAMVQINVGKMNNALTVPNEAIVKEMGRDIAYLYKDGRAEQIELTLGRRMASKVQILEGLQIGDTLITTGVMQLRDGAAVNINGFVE
ncbi:efflux RND transporter periplasmic adaptor subunit [Bacteroidales bacterium OttesenSCG-928-A17]|nr:efflux RND transporter periplasmic adaptor subunit [Bacteroidales bacterium OttesenSCG-928-A17]